MLKPENISAIINGGVLGNDLSQVVIRLLPHLLGSTRNDCLTQIALLASELDKRLLTLEVGKVQNSIFSSFQTFEIETYNGQTIKSLLYGARGMIRWNDKVVDEGPSNDEDEEDYGDGLGIKPIIELFEPLVRERNRGFDSRKNKKVYLASFGTSIGVGEAFRAVESIGYSMCDSIDTLLFAGSYRTVQKPIIGLGKKELSESIVLGIRVFGAQLGCKLIENVVMNNNDLIDPDCGILIQDTFW